MLTWGDLETGQQNISWATAAKYENWAATDPADSVGILAAGMKTTYYSDPNRTRPGDWEYTNVESAFAHDCTGARITVPGRPGDPYLMQPDQGTLEGLWQNQIYTVTKMWGGQFTALYDDTPDDVVGVTALPCNWTQTQWTNLTISMIQAEDYSVIYNGLNMPSQKGGLTLPPSLALLGTTLGGQSEGCYDGYDAISPKLDGLAWQAEEDTELAVQQQNKLFICHGFTAADGSTAWAIDIRQYHYASFLLTYNLATSLFATKWLTTSGFQIQPETQLVPTKPLVATPSTVASLLQSTGVYAREYAACYFATKYVGPCATVVNSNKAGNLAFPWPTKYHHTLVLTGSGIVDGGLAQTNGGPPPAYLAPETGFVVFK